MINVSGRIPLDSEELDRTGGEEVRLLRGALPQPQVPPHPPEEVQSHGPGRHPQPQDESGVQFNRNFRHFLKPVPNHVWSHEACLPPSISGYRQEMDENISTVALMVCASSARLYLSFPPFPACIL